ncbi:cytochrome c3 family protein [Bacillus sp. USDA818B3_A]|uniref:cytochrome c3 family protein n=1 Tax=Bacillus sp. USDA818B3_A TaxID=2698834 RepID=UPI00136E4A51|nr:cytochrome c3 family protein [Bacillus sp. USDA818B3_A]
MSKIKMSFSLILAIFLVGILSTAAFAKDPYGLKPYQSGLDLVVPFNANTANGETKDSSYDMSLKLGDTVVKSYYDIHVDATTLKGSVTIPASVVTPGTVYTVELYARYGTTPLSKSTGLVTDSHNTGMYQLPDDHVDKDGSGLQNANQTGYNNTRKQRTGQKVHGFYTNNTNSCASCHQTHTAADGEYLLFKDGTYSTCSACHDGTTGAYNSFAPVSEENADSISGTFNVQTAGHNGSLHDADGSLQVSAAPGGNNNPDTAKGSVGASTWGAEFDCASCHAAHGSGTSSENNLNLDPMGWAQVAYSTTTKDTQNGKLFQNLSVNSTVPTTFSTPYILVKKTLTASDISTDKTKYGYLYSRAKLAAGDKVIQTYRWDGSKYVADYSLWLRDKGHVGAPFSNADTFFKDSTGTDITNTLNVVWKDGFASGSAVDNVSTAQIAIGVDVETTDNIASLFDTANANYVVDSGLQMSKYCSACHTDYLSATRTNDTGTYTTAHRHKTGADNLTCVRCHFAHGSESQLMSDANDQNYFEKVEAGMTPTAALDYLKDPNPSSALKRYTGMSVCYACHGQGEQFLGNPNNKERPVSGQPGAARGSNY